MRKIFSIAIVLFICNTAGAQGFFNQKGAWIKNQVKQIALWQVYLTDIRKGYEIARDGLAAIEKIKRGDFQLRQDRFNSLGLVSQPVKNYSKTGDILQMHSIIKKLYIKGDDDYVNAVFTQLIKFSDRDLEQLSLLLSPGNYVMTDDERIRKIDRLYSDMKDKYCFAVSFTNDLKVRALQQSKEMGGVRSERLLNNIKLP